MSTAVRQKPTRKPDVRHVDAARLERDLREAVIGGVRIDTIGLGAGQDRHLLRTLAAESGGLYQAL